MTVIPQAADDLGYMHGVPDQDGIGQQAQATGLVHDLGEIAGTELPLVGKKIRAWPPPGDAPRD